MAVYGRYFSLHFSSYFRVLMMALYNISINQKGFLMMQGETRLLQTISRYIVNERSPELKLMALRLLMSLSVHITSVQILKDMVNYVSVNNLSCNTIYHIHFVNTNFIYILGERRVQKWNKRFVNKNFKCVLNLKFYWYLMVLNYFMNEY